MVVDAMDVMDVRLCKAGQYSPLVGRWPVRYGDREGRRQPFRKNRAALQASKLPTHGLVNCRSN